MYRLKCQRCDHRVVSIHQPHVRPTVRGKANKVAEFGTKLNVNLTVSGIASVDHIRWDAFHEGGDLPTQVEATNSVTNIIHKMCWVTLFTVLETTGIT